MRADHVTSRRRAAGMGDTTNLLELRRLAGKSQWAFAASPRLAVQPAAGKGRGVFALCDFEPGEMIIAEAPLLAWDIDLTSERTDLSELEGLADALSPASQRAFFDLCDPSAPLAKTAFGIWSSNAYVREFGDCFEPEADQGVSRGAVFRIICRMNHECRPNGHVAWNHAIHMQTVHALQAIEAGSEVTVCFLGADALASRASRREQLRRTKRFECACSACTLAGEALARSEQRMRRLTSLRAQMGTGSLTGAALVECVDEMWRLAEADGAPHVWLRSEALAAMVHAQQDSTGGVKQALQWARRGAVSTRLALGADAPTTYKFEVLAKRAWARVVAVR